MLFLVSVVVAAAVGIAAGRVIGQSEVIEPGRATARLPVYAEVDSRVVDDRLTFSGVVKPGAEVPLEVNLGEPSAMVVRQGLQPGGTAEWGALAAVLSGRPYFLLPGPLPLYRDLSLGDEGEDVLALQRALRTIGYAAPENGTVDLPTLRTAQKLFASEGFTLADDAPLPHRQFMVLPAQNARVVAAAPAGRRLSPEEPVATIQSADNSVEIVVDVQQVGSLKVGQNVLVRIAEKQVQGVVSAVGPFKEAGNGAKAGHVVTVRPADPADLPLLTAHTSVTVLGRGAAGEATAVPLTAIRQDGDGTYVLRTSGPAVDGVAPVTRVSVTVVRSGGGFAAITGEVRPGDRVEVS